MYIHLGNDVVVSEESIIGVFDIENTSISKKTKEFLSAAQKNGSVVYVTDDLPKSFIVCQKDSKTEVYICQLAPTTILKRNLLMEKEKEELRRVLSEEEESEI